MISVVYAVHNEEEILARSLASVQDWADEIIIVDGESSDKTVEIAAGFGAQVISTTNKANFHINKQMAIDAAHGELILQLDADEVVDTSLREFILQVAAGQRDEKIAAWQIRRRNLFCRHWLTKGGQYPDMVIRLLRAGQAYLPQKDVHEQMVVKGKLGTANGHLLHFANPDLSSYFRKFNTYTSFRAQQLAEAKVSVSVGNFWRYCLWRPTTTFWSLWLRHRGYKDGLAGFLFALFSGWHHLVAYCKYVEQQRPLPDGRVTVYYPGNQIEKKAARGVGRYAAWLQEACQEVNTVKIVDKKSAAQVIHYTFFDLYKNTLRPVKKNQKLVVTVHDLIPLLFPKDYPVGWRGRINLWRQKSQLKKAAAIVADSQATKDDLVTKFKLPAQKITVVYLAANPKLQAAGAEQIAQIKKSYALPDRYLLYVGDINFNKNLAQLIKALKFLPSEIHLVMVGKNFVPSDIPEWIILQEQMDLSEVKDRVKFLSSVTLDSELSALYSGAVAYVQPSYYEGFGLPLLEAMRCRTPVICQRNSSLSEVGGEHVIYSDSLRAEDFAAAVLKVLDLTAGQREQMINKAEVWQQEFTWARTARTMAQIYEKVAGEN